MAIRYVSTRGNGPELNFEDVLLAGLASDGGLYVPTSLPHFSKEDLLAIFGPRPWDKAEEVKAKKETKKVAKKAPKKTTKKIVKKETKEQKPSETKKDA